MIRTFLLLPLLLAATAQAAELVVHLDRDARSATLVAPAIGVKTQATIDGKTLTCANLLTQTSYDLAVTLKDDQILQGVDMTWYAPIEPTDAVPAPLADDDRAEIQSIVKDVPSFYDRATILRLQGDGLRAVALVELVRDREFYASKGNVIWRIELWYFEQQHGGWSKVQQQNKVLRRERFKSDAAFKQATGKIRWIPALGGIRLTADDQRLELTLHAE